MGYNDTENYILQTLSGIIPRDLWIHRKREKGQKPFDGFTDSEKRIASRKFRKLKRKAGVRKTDSAKVAWSKINWFLKKKSER